MKLDRRISFFKTGERVVGLALALAGAASLAGAQDLPSAPMANPNSLVNPYFGSVTKEPATDGLLKLSLDDAVTRGLTNNLGLKNAEVGERALRGQKLEAIQFFCRRLR